VTLAHSLDGRGPTHVLLLHDWLGDASNYDAALPFFDLDALTLARVDLPGYGASRAVPVPGMDAGALEAAVLAVTDHLGWERFHLVAHSMSTVIAQRLARAHAERLASVTLTTPVAPGTHLPDEAIAFLRALGRTPGIRREALSARGNPHLGARWLDQKLARWSACADPEAVAAYVDLFARPQLATTRAEVRVPVLALTGADDGEPFRRAAVEPALRAVYPDAVVEELPTGHYPMQEMPPRFAARVERFVRTLAPR
jgi:pimeloyl-ACP methyl ester carboxylesterase